MLVWNNNLKVRFYKNMVFNNTLKSTKTRIIILQNYKL